MLVTCIVTRDRQINTSQMLLEWLATPFPFLTYCRQLRCGAAQTPLLGMESDTDVTETSSVVCYKDENIYFTTHESYTPVFTQEK